MATSVLGRTSWSRWNRCQRPGSLRAGVAGNLETVLKTDHCNMQMQHEDLHFACCVPRLLPFRLASALFNDKRRLRPNIRNPNGVPAFENGQCLRQNVTTAPSLTEKRRSREGFALQ